MDEKMESNSPYALPNVSGNFTSKSNDIFACLDTIEAKHSAYQAATKRRDGQDEKLWKDDPSFDYLDSKRKADKGGNVKSQLDRHRPRSDIERAGGRHDNRRDGGFARPRGLPPRNHRKPDHLKNPHNYQFYDLSDVSKGDMSERSNTAAAFEFLNSRANDKDNTDKMDVDSNDLDCKPMHSFKKPQSANSAAESKSSVSDKNNCLQLGASKHVMPEYVVGAPSKPKTTTNKPKPKINSSNVEVNIKDNLAEIDDPEDSLMNESRSVADDKGTMFSFKKRGKGKSGFRGRREEDSDDEDNTPVDVVSKSNNKRTHSSPEISEEEDTTGETGGKKMKNRLYNRKRIVEEDDSD